MKSSIFICLVSCLLLFVKSEAQNTPEWSVSSSDNSQFGSMIATDNDGNVVAVGYRPSYIINAFIYTYKYDNTGALLWSAQSASNVPNTYEKASWLNIDGENNIYVTGYRYSGTSNIYTSDIIIIKYNSSGQQQWKKIIPHPFNNALPMRSVMDEEGNLYIGTIAVDSGFNLIKINSSGEQVFLATDNTANNMSFSSMRIKNNLVVMTSPASNGFSASVAAFNTSGEYLWSHQLDTHGAPDLEISDDQRIFVLSRKPNLVNTTSDYDVHLIEFNYDGVQLNNFSFDFEGGNEFPSRMTLVNNRITIIGPIIPAGEAYMDWMTFQIDMSGNLIWSAIYDEMISNDEKPYWITALPSGDVYVSGQGGPGFTDFNGSTYMQYVVLRYSQGEIIWSNTNIYQGYIATVSVLDLECGLYVLGETATTVNHYNDECDTQGTFETTAEEFNSGFTIYPNPTQSDINIIFQNHKNSIEELHLYDQVGKLVHTSRIHLTANKLSQNISLPSLSTGIYYLQIGHSTQKLVIE